MTAQESRQLSIKSGYADTLAVEAAHVGTAIYNAASRGQVKLEYTYSLAYETIEALRKDGYNVLCMSAHYHLITW